MKDFVEARHIMFYMKMDHKRTHYVRGIVHKSTVQKFEAISDKCNINGICRLT
jgi:hypothetical protein